MEDLFLIDQSHAGQPVDTKYNDLEIQDYDLATLEGPSRKVQDVIKALLTDQGSNLVYPSYGTTLSRTPGQRSTDDLNIMVSDTIREVMGWLQQIEESTRPDERLSRVVSLTLVDGVNATEKQLNLVVELENGELIRTSFPVNP